MEKQCSLTIYDALGELFEEEWEVMVVLALWGRRHDILIIHKDRISSRAKYRQRITEG